MYSYAQYYNQQPAPSAGSFSYGAGPPQIGFKPNGHRGFVPGPMYQHLGSYSYGVQNPGVMGYGRSAPAQQSQFPPVLPYQYGAPSMMRRMPGMSQPMMNSKPWWVSDEEWQRMTGPKQQIPYALD